jgi:hypothetical protein
VDFDPRLPSFDSEAEVARFMAAGATHFTAGGGRAAVPEMTAPRQPTFADGVVVVIDGLTQRPELNGRRGVVQGFHRSAERCVSTPASYLHSSLVGWHCSFLKASGQPCVVARIPVNSVLLARVVGHCRYEVQIQPSKNQDIRWGSPGLRDCGCGKATYGGRSLRSSPRSQRRSKQRGLRKGR